MQKKICILILVFFLPILARKQYSSSHKYPEKEKRHKLSYHPANYKFVSRDAVREICDFILDDTKQEHCYNRVLPPFTPEDIFDGSLVFVKSEMLEEFFTIYFSRIKARFVMITHAGDDPAPGRFIDYLEDSRIIAWFAEHKSVDYHPKFFGLPIGLASQFYPHGNVEIVRHMRSQRNILPKKYLLYLNLDTNTYPDERNFVRDYFKEKSFCTFSPQRKPYNQFLQDIIQSKFVLSPRGHALDCHRTWETFLMGSFPVLKACTLDDLYEGLPAVIINDWHEVTEEFLIQRYQEMFNKPYAWHKLFMKHWISKIIEVLEKEGF